MAKASTLSETMLSIADRDGLPDDHPLRQLAFAVKNATQKFYVDDQMTEEKFVNTWVKARKLLGNYLGEI